MCVQNLSCCEVKVPMICPGTAGVLSSLPSRVYEVVVDISLLFSHFPTRNQVAARKLRRS
jgi:hypothetical protein